MNVLITNRCNLSCPYCFARLKTTDPRAGAGGDEHMTLENYLTCLDFLERSRQNEVRILGGEPTLHPRLEEFLAAALKRKMEVLIFSNGLWSEKVRSLFERPEMSAVKFVINTNASVMEDPAMKRSLEKTLAIAGKRAALGFNIYQREFSMGFLGDLIEAWDLQRTVRLGLASPIIGFDNACIADEDLKAAGKRLIAELSILEKKDVLGSFDCGFPFCLFDEQDLGRLAMTSVGFTSICSPPIDVGVDLTVWSCFPLSMVLNVKLTDFPNSIAIRDYYRSKLDAFKSFGQTEECLTCKYLRRGQCSGGCFARNLRRWQKDDPSLLEKINRMAEA
ncbi:MAG: radical SAM protein [Acidobacteriota bacterium]|nr:radical SAM protein [Acidobacteriota bacterium]